MFTRCTQGMACFRLDDDEADLRRSCDQKTNSKTVQQSRSSTMKRHLKQESLITRIILPGVFGSGVKTQMAAESFNLESQISKHSIKTVEGLLEQWWVI